MSREDDKLWRRQRNFGSVPSNVIWGNHKTVRSQPHPRQGPQSLPQHPPGLRGKEIGLYYRNMSRLVPPELRKEKRKEHVLNLTIPPAVENQIHVNLQTIRKIATQLNIPISYTKPVFTFTNDISSKPRLSSESSGADLIPILSPNKEVVDCFNMNNDVKLENTVKDEGESTAPLDKPQPNPLDIENTCSSSPRKEDKCYPNEDDTKILIGDVKNNSEISETLKKPLEFNSTGTLSLKNEVEDCPNTNDVDILVNDEKAKIEDSNDADSETNMSIEDVQSTEDVFKKPNFIPIHKNQRNEVTTPASIPDFIKIGNEAPNYYGTGDRLLSLRGDTEYKYSYEDIITGMFDEKLDERLSKGISINMATKEIEDLNLKLNEEYKNMISKSPYTRMLKFRKTLPTYIKSQEFLDAMNSTQIIVISGETGCGKSTQIPQILLDDAIRNNCGANVKILVTQPRRIAASSLAARVSEERAEKMGNSVGYAVRLEKVEARPRGSIMFCTTGILLADLEVNQGLTDYSHVILDEVHERDCHVDFSMCMLKKVLKKRKDLKLILMSATIDAEKLSQYFDNCPMMHIEGLAYPVEDIYMEQILQMTRYELPPPKQIGHQPKWMKYRKHGRNSNKIEEKDVQYKAEIAPWLESIKHTLHRDVYRTLADSRIEDLNEDLICNLLIHISHGPPGAILVFLPGIGQISKLMNIMEQSHYFPQSRFEIYPLHSKLPSLDQHRIFARPPEGIRKIIVATNIAETSITIDDIVYVIDCGKIKISGLNVKEKVATLQIEWVSQANLRQRRGRAGRCQPGICYHLMTSYRASQLQSQFLPELQRSNLLEPVLTIKRLRLGKAADALNIVPSPPDPSTVQWAVKHLQQCGGLDDKETLTPLGWHLARLPVHPSAGKLLLLGALFGCLDRAASVAAVWGFKDPFQLVIGKELEVDDMKRRFALGEPSDQIAISEAIIQWEGCSNYHRRSFAYEHFLSNNTLELLSDMKKQLGQSLKQMGFLASGDVKSAWENRNADNLSLFKSLVAAALYPNIATVRWINLRKNMQRKKKQMSIKAYTPEDCKFVAVHPSSVMRVNTHKYRNPIVPLCDNPGANWLVYWLKQRSSDLFLIEVTLVYTLPLLFFGELKVTTDENEPDYCHMMVSTVKVRCKRKTAELLHSLRTLLDQVLASKIMVSSDHATRHCDFEDCVLGSVIQLLTAEDEQADYLGSDPSESDASESDTSQGHSSKQYKQ